jgi:hypothetical protein
VDGRTPFEAWFGRKPDVHFLKVFGCKAHAKVTRPNLKKLDDRSVHVVFLGYAPGGKAYRCYDPASKRVVVTRDVVFDEGQPWPWTADGNENSSSEITVEYTVYEGAPEKPFEEQQVQEDRALAESSAAVLQPTALTAQGRSSSRPLQRLMMRPQLTSIQW